MGSRELGRRALRALALVVTLPAYAAASMLSLETIGLDYEDVSWVPVPEIILDPNEGDTWGLMAAGLFVDEEDEVKFILAPDLRWNETKGTFPVFRILAYPEEDRFWTLLIGKSTTKDEDYEAEYEDYTLEAFGRRAFIEAKALYERDSTERFWGFGNDSDEERESNYTGANFFVQAMPGLFVLPKLSVAFKTRVRHFEVQEGQVSGQPFIGDEHPSIRRERGLDPAWYWVNGLALSYDSRDSRDLPSEGTYANAYVEGADRRLGSASSFVRYGLEWRAFVPFRRVRNPILAMRARLDWMSARRSSTPFWEQHSLGGRRLLRGFGSDRFIDLNRSLATAELRTRVWEVRLFGVDAEVELAPFIESGQVFRDLSESPMGDLHWVYGLGFRGIVRPQILAFVDVGAGEEGMSVFTGIDYPF